MRLSLSLLWLFGLFVPRGGDLSAEETRPNVLFIAVDDLNDWVGCLGGCPGKVHTPHIDALAESGMLFTNAHCPAPVCNASRTAILTGQRPSRTGVYDNSQWWRPALPSVKTLPEYFAANGYLSAGGGKVFHHTPGFNPPAQWDSFFAQVFDDPWHRAKPGEPLPVRESRWPEGFPLNNFRNVREGIRPPANPREFDWGAFDRPDAEMGDGQMMSWAKAFLQQCHEKPFFLATGIFRPHLPWYVPRKYFELYPLEKIVLPTVREDDLEDLPAMGKEIARERGDEWEYLKQEGRWHEAVRAYLASITFADAMVGELLDALESSEYAENTIVVLWSDHGWHLGEKHHWHKMTLWEEATRVPLIVRVPGLTEAGMKTNQPVNLIDLYPTLVELCGLPQNSDLDGESLVRLLRDPATERDRPSLTTHSLGNHSLRSARYRYIRYRDGTEELYDHERDPHEWTNRAENPDLAKIKKQLQKWLPVKDAPPALKKGAYRFDALRNEWQLKAE